MLEEKTWRSIAKENLYIKDEKRRGFLAATLSGVKRAKYVIEVRTRKFKNRNEEKFFWSWACKEIVDQIDFEAFYQAHGTWNVKIKINNNVLDFNF